MKKAPKGWDMIEPTLSELHQKLRDGKYNLNFMSFNIILSVLIKCVLIIVENEPIEGKRKPEVHWPIYKLHHQMSRYVYELFYKKKEISRELYEFCLREKWADAALIAKWKKSGFERLCCVQCIQKGDSAFGKGCICRVPKSHLEE